MTIRQLYEWAKKNNAADYSIEIQYRDDGGNMLVEKVLKNPILISMGR